MTRVIEWFYNIKEFLAYWFQESWKQAAGFGTSIWGLIIIVGTLIWTLVTHLIPLLHQLLSTVNGLVTGNFNYTPPGVISEALAIANTFAPLDELMGFAVVYGTMKATIAIYRFVKGLIPTESGT